MEFISDGSVSLKISCNQNDDLLGYSEVWINGKNTNCLIKGYCLRACIKSDDFYILFTSEDYPFSHYLPWSEATTSDHPLKWVDIHEATIYLMIKVKCLIKHRFYRYLQKRLISKIMMITKILNIMERILFGLN